MRIKYEESTQYLRVIEGLGSESVRHYVSRINIITKNLQENELPDKKYINSFISGLFDKGYKNNSINSYVNAINALHRMLVYMGFEVEDFTLKTYKRNTTPIEVLTVEEISKILNTDLEYGIFHGQSSERLNETYKTFTHFLATTGCRYSEASSLQINAIEWARNRCVFRDTKNGEWRYGYLNKKLLSELKTEVGNRKPNEHVFITLLGNAIPAQNFTQDLKKRAKKAGITKHVNPHLFRHSFATQLVSDGWTIEHVRTLTGHKDISSLQRYLHLADTISETVSLSHPLNSQTLSPQKIIERDLDMIKMLGSYKDPRFKVSYQVSEGKMLFVAELKNIDIY